MAKASLTSYVETFRVGANGEMIPIVSSFPIPLDRGKPLNRLVALYGTATMVGALKEVHQKARKEKRFFFRADMIIDVGEEAAGWTSLEMLERKEIIHIGRIKVDLRDEIHKILNPKKNPLPIDAIGNDPTLLNKIWDDKRFSHVKIIVWQAPLVESAKKHEIISLAAIRSPDCIESYDLRQYQGDPETAEFSF